MKITSSILVKFRSVINILLHPLKCKFPPSGFWPHVRSEITVVLTAAFVRQRDKNCCILRIISRVSAIISSSRTGAGLTVINCSPTCTIEIILAPLHCFSFAVAFIA